MHPKAHQMLIKWGVCFSDKIYGIWMKKCDIGHALEVTFCQQALGDKETTKNILLQKLYDYLQSTGISTDKQSIPFKYKTKNNNIFIHLSMNETCEKNHSAT
jgi:hypothetical protein